MGIATGAAAFTPQDRQELTNRPHLPEDFKDPTDEFLKTLTDEDIAWLDGLANAGNCRTAAGGTLRPTKKQTLTGILVMVTPAVVRVMSGEGVTILDSHWGERRDRPNAIGTPDEGLTSLSYLNLSYCGGVTDASLAYLRAFPGLREQLFLRGCGNIFDAGL